MLAERGARIGSLRVGDTELLVTGDADDDPIQWGAYVMAPWVGRIRDGVFSHEGVTVELPRRFGEHAGHGLVDDIEWTRVDAPSDRHHHTRLAVDIPEPWPFGGRVEHDVTLYADRLVAVITITAGERSMPAESGWHPWFRTEGPITFHPRAMYERDDMIPTGELITPAPPPWDDCFLGDGPITFPLGPLDVTVDHDHDHVVVFDGLADHGIAVEPQTGPPDAVHIRPRILPPGGVLRHTMTIAWQPRSPTDR